jgi:hypothetical protein
MPLRRVRALALAVLFSHVLTAPLRADGLVRDGIGPISTGRGGTNQGFADNSVIILDNPAAMVNVSGSGLAEIGVDTVITSVSYSDPLNNVDGAVRPIPAPVIGLIKKSEDGRWAYGIGAFSPAGFGSSYGYMDTPFAGSQYTRSIGAMGKILPALSFRATDRLALGISVGIAASYASLEGPLIMQTGPLAGSPAIMDIEGTGVAPCGSVGMQYQLTEKMMIGATYTEQTNVWLDEQRLDAAGLRNGLDRPGHVPLRLRVSLEPFARLDVESLSGRHSAACVQPGLQPPGAEGHAQLRLSVQLRPDPARGRKRPDRRPVRRFVDERPGPLRDDLLPDAVLEGAPRPAA